MNLDDPIPELSKAIRLHRQLATEARAEFQAALPVLAEILSHDSGLSAKVEKLERILNSIWNAEHSKNPFPAAEVAQSALAVVTGQSAKVATLLQSCWNGELCDNLAGLDAKVVQAVLAMITLRAFADPARADYKSALPILRETLAHRSGQSDKVERILQSIMDGELCDALSGLVPDAAQCVLAMIGIRAHLGGDADDLLRPLLNPKEGQP